jgi:hypothetical protein
MARGPAAAAGHAAAGGNCANANAGGGMTAPDGSRIDPATAMAIMQMRQLQAQRQAEHLEQLQAAYQLRQQAIAQERAANDAVRQERRDRIKAREQAAKAARLKARAEAE